DFEGATFEFPSSSFSAGAFNFMAGWGDLGSMPTETNTQLLPGLTRTGDISTWDFESFLTTPGPALSTIPKEAPANVTPFASSPRLPLW
ncbi:uncharacterized protein SCHCODRAFT_02457216, partial [Schizophyllum commune H4-8]|uniref:uncharacterized protein n=1 Tax=Schizophyllum commune (strain H4-8 / FGSC 9210) TaxID=578458 RepID=UPI002160E4A1